jgi:hypothetical protein
LKTGTCTYKLPVTLTHRRRKQTVGFRVTGATLDLAPQFRDVLASWERRRDGGQDT